jgi:hypothetical protein
LQSGDTHIARRAVRLALESDSVVFGKELLETVAFVKRSLAEILT